jgi:hypothetical protein
MYNQHSEDPVDLVTSIASTLFHEIRSLHALHAHSRSRRVKSRTPKPSAWICLCRSGGTRLWLPSVSDTVSSLRFIPNLSHNYSRITAAYCRILVAFTASLDFLPPCVTSQYLGSCLATKCSVSLSVWKYELLNFWGVVVNSSVTLSGSIGFDSRSVGRPYLLSGKCEIKKQEVLGRNNCLLSFDTTWTV